MRAGAMRSFIEIQSASETPNTFGERVQTWGGVAQVWCEFRNVTGRERFAADQIQGQVVAIARMRYLAGITPKMRVLFQGKTYLIRGVANVKGLNREMELELEEFVDA